MKMCAFFRSPYGQRLAENVEKYHAPRYISAEHEGRVHLDALDARRPAGGQQGRQEEGKVEIEGQVQDPEFELEGVRVQVQAVDKDGTGPQEEVQRAEVEVETADQVASDEGDEELDQGLERGVQGGFEKLQDRELRDGRQEGLQEQSGEGGLEDDEQVQVQGVEEEVNAVQEKVPSGKEGLFHGQEKVPRCEERRFSVQEEVFISVEEKISTFQEEIRDEEEK